MVRILLNWVKWNFCALTNEVEPVRDRSPEVPNLPTQVQTFIRSHPQADADALYTIWAGSNDYLQGATNPDLVIASLVRTVESLAAIRAEKFLVAKKN